MAYFTCSSTNEHKCPREARLLPSLPSGIQQLSSKCRVKLMAIFLKLDRHIAVFPEDIQRKICMINRVCRNGDVGPCHHSMAKLRLRTEERLLIRRADADSRKGADLQRVTKHSTRPGRKAWDSSSGWEQVAGSCEYGNERLGSVNCM
jgi:hypothetical protein